MELKVNAKENTWFVLRVVFSLLTVIILAAQLAEVANFDRRTAGMLLPMIFAFVFYGLLFALYFFLLKVFLVGHLKGNGVQVTSAQFPEVHAMLGEIAVQFGLKTVPPVFLIQQGGLLNAFAVRFGGREYVAIYSEIFALLKTDPEALKFVLAHELAHVKNNHLRKRFWTLLSGWVPFLGAAYSRACEFTCDNFAHAVASEGSARALVMLAAGPALYPQVDTAEYVRAAEANATSVVKFAGLLASHPYLPKRLRNLAVTA